MGELSGPTSVEQLYASWGEVPSVARPLMQGDVFSGVVLPGLSEEPQMAQVVMHPCNMRRGAVLRDRITVAPVHPHSMRSSDWQKRVRIMPLPELVGSGQPAYLTDLCDFVSVPSESLSVTNRLAALSNEGVLLLQQRLVFTQTRVLLGLDRYQEQMAPTFTELELQEDWTEEALAAQGGEDPTEAEVNRLVAAAVVDFQAWLDPQRERLARATEHGRLRREARKECAERY